MLKAAAHWREVALLGQGSVFGSGQLWTIEKLEAIDRNFSQNPDTGKAKFLAKLEAQLKPCTPEVMVRQRQPTAPCVQPFKPPAQNSWTDRSEISSFIRALVHRVPAKSELLMSYGPAYVGGPGGRLWVRWRLLRGRSLWQGVLVLAAIPRSAMIRT